MTSRDMRDRLQEALDVYDVDQHRGKTLLQKLVVELRDGCNTLKSQLEQANGLVASVEQEASKTRASLQEARIQLESLSQQLQNGQGAWRQMKDEVGTLRDTLNERPSIEVADIRFDILDMVAQSTATNIDYLNAEFKQNLVEQCIQMKNLSLTEWASKLDTSGLMRVLHAGYSELGFWQFATGKVNIVNFKLCTDDNLTEIPSTDEARKVLWESGWHRKGLAKTLSKLLTQGKLTIQEGRVYRPSEVKLLALNDGASNDDNTKPRGSS